MIKYPYKPKDPEGYKIANTVQDAETSRKDKAQSIQLLQNLKSGYQELKTDMGNAYGAYNVSNCYLYDIFNDTNLLPPIDNEDSNIIININSCSNHIDNDIIINKDLSTEHNDNHLLFSKYGDNSPLFEGDDFNTSSSSLFENDNFSDRDAPSYQHNFHVGDYFDDWLSVDRIIYNYCLEQGFGFQVFHNNKDLNNPNITHRKSFCCSSSGIYEPQKVINQNSHHIQVNSAQIVDIIARYRHFSKEIIQDIKFFLDCYIAPMIQLEMLKKKYLQHVFYKQDIYNPIYKSHKNNNKRLNSVSFLDVLLEKMSQDPC
ncbi:10518_t:CDS:2 [Gigaspora margarita]|uniref:10518_t:CDS:1 n=1 Tax=Gigaspora margarita TaxID=4874 RepID=A0ABN7VFV2_GIGMA|nr:10518_t:CDS:2 [Gigaspora margarita]